MKRIITLSLVAVCLFSGCDSWIDVAPKTEVKSKEIFSTEEGFKSALIGVYARMTNDETYGKNLSYGFIEELVQRYDNYPSSNIPSDEERANIYDYKNFSTSKGLISTVWKEMYKNIANINNLINQLEQVGDKVLTTPLYYDLIKGEAHALRAFHYFDLLRLWGPIYAENPTAKSLPWRVHLNIDQVENLPANQILDNIITDLKIADQFLKNDPMILNSSLEDLFLGNRRFRMNKYAVKALLARVYLYSGDIVNAQKYAQDVINNSEITLVSDNREDVSLSNEALFCLNMFNMEIRIANDWKNTQSMDMERWISTDNIRSTFEFFTVGVNDIRYRNGYGFIHGSNRYMCRKYLSNIEQYKNRIPMIRLGEMYLIMAESVPLDQSHIYLNTLRNARGLSRSNNLGAGITEAQRIDYLNREYQKEFFAEGQWFHFLKRHNIKQFYRLPIEEMIFYTLPIPDDEIEFGNISQ